MTNIEKCSDNQEKELFEFIFGFGSIINTSTHALWHNQSSSSSSSSSAKSAKEFSGLPGALVTLKKSFGYARRWNFRSSTGFTALGVSPCSDNNNNINNNNQQQQLQPFDANDINGVLFQVPSSMIFSCCN